jgi:hypothetical protein
MQKTNLNGNLNFHAQVKSYLPPKIVDEITMDDGERHYVLENGHTSLVSRYNSLWKPKPTEINWKAKGPSIGNKQAKY